MTKYQRQLLTILTASENGRLSAEWSGDFLNCVVKIDGANGKPKRQKFSFVFDDAACCHGACIVAGSKRGAYSDVYAERAAAQIFKFTDQLVESMKLERGELKEKMIEATYKNKSEWHVVAVPYGWDAVFVSGVQSRPSGVNFDKYRDAAAYALAGANGVAVPKT